MIEIVNRQRWPVQIIVRSRKTPRSFTTLNIPGIGQGKNVRYIEDEVATEYLDRAKQAGYVTTRQINSKNEN